ncbi:S24 family peptidase [Marinobacter salinus]|nr:helix-turn-helix transcriptional regulator [Marinobacter salinus]
MLSDLGWSWARFARELDTTDQRVYNWRKRGVPKSEVDRIADILGCSTDFLLKGSDFETRDEDGNLLMLVETKQATRRMRRPDELKEHEIEERERRAKHELEFFGHMDAWDSNTPLDEDEVELPLFREVELAAGAGQTQVVENHGAKLRFAKSTLSRAGVEQEYAACAFVRGNSMEPVMPDGTCVGVNTGDTTVRDGEIYAIDHDGMLRVKYLHRRPGGGIKIVSQNASEHATEEYSAQDVIDNNIRIIGRVFWWSVLR